MRTREAIEEAEKMYIGSPEVQSLSTIKNILEVVLDIRDLPAPTDTPVKDV